LLKAVLLSSFVLRIFALEFRFQLRAGLAPEGLTTESQRHEEILGDLSALVVNDRDPSTAQDDSLGEGDGHAAYPAGCAVTAHQCFFSVGAAEKR
jgi:hypothetical protein